MYRPAYKLSTASVAISSPTASYGGGGSSQKKQKAKSPNEGSLKIIQDEVAWATQRMRDPRCDPSCQRTMTDFIAEKQRNIAMLSKKKRGGGCSVM